jgi:signal transduction histidine kinase
MPDSFPPAARAVHRAATRNGRSLAPMTFGGNLRSELRRTSLLAAAATTLLGAVAVTWLLVAASASISAGTIVVLSVCAAGCLTVLVVAVRRADRVAVSVDRTVDSVRGTVLQGQNELQRLLEQLQRGERPALGPPPTIPADGNDPIALLQDAVYRSQHAALAALVQAAALSPAPGPGTQVEVFVNLARRLQSLVHRAIQLLDDLENQVEDPDLLKGLFQVDHLATRIRRHAENLAVLGGADSRRQWTTPQALTEVLRSAIAEVEQYSRVKLVPPVEGTLHGHAVADVIHLVAELVENATMFSAPHASVLLRIQTVTAGLVVEVEDRGLGMSRSDQQRVNSLLADPHRIDIGALLRDGRLGLYVVSAIARRHGIAVQLQSNIFGGTQAIVIVPHGLLGAPPVTHELRVRVAAEQPPPNLTRRQPVAALAGQVPASVPVAAPPDHTAPPPQVLVSTDSIRPLQEASPGMQEPVRAPAAPAADGPPPRPSSVDQAGRPPLPQRVSQSHLAPQLQQPATPTRDEPAGEHDPRLMAAFRQGYNQAEAGGDEDDDM